MKTNTNIPQMRYSKKIVSVQGWLARFAILGCSIVLGTASYGQRCATPEPSYAQSSLYANIVASYLQHKSLSRFQALEKIPVAFHIVRASETGWDITDQQILDQLAVLNTSGAYPDMNIEFYLHSIQRHIEPQWQDVPLDLSKDNNSTEGKMKAALSVKTNRIMNVYIVDDAGGNLGYAWFPDDFPAASPWHGVVIVRSTLPYNNDPAFGEGDTLTHEVGHFLGLFHTFQDGCSTSGGGDQCDDTPYHLVNYGTPDVNTDTCTALPGNDPVHNFMNYVNDEWMREFTDDQSTRAVAISSDLKSDIYKDYLWGDYSWNAGNWRNATWFEWVYDAYYPWIYSFPHGWQYGDSETESSVWFHDSELGWIHTGSTLYPWYYSTSLSAYIMYYQGTSSPRKFYNDATKQDFFVGQGARTSL